MSAIKMLGNLPGGSKNGLPSILDDLTDHPNKMHLVLAVIDTKSVTTDVDTGYIVPTVHVLRIEPIRPEDRKTAHRLMERALEERTGRPMLPADLEDDTLAVLTDSYGATGE